MSTETQSLGSRWMEHELAHISEKEWSAYTKADYSIEQWHSACLIHQHEGPPTSKGECKLPVKTPNGALNRNGVHAAAAALAGARGGVNASSEQKAAAARALVRYYSQLDEEPPDSLKHSGVRSFIEHYGVRGMRWGVRKGSSRVSRPSGEARKASELRRKPVHQLTNKQLKAVNERMNLEQNYNRLNPSRTKRGRAYVTAAIGAIGTGVGLYNMVNSPAGKAFISTSKKALASAKLKSTLARQARRTGQMAFDYPFPT
jgi:hypothetical protein